MFNQINICSGIMFFLSHIGLQCIVMGLFNSIVVLNIFNYYIAVSHKD